MNAPLDTDLQRFILKHIHSVEQLDILCLLVEGRGKLWSDKEVFFFIQSSRASVSLNLLYFSDQGLLHAEPEGAYRFVELNDKKAQLAIKLAKVYRERRVSVIDAIYKTNTNNAQQFADAFKIREEKK